MSRINDGSAIPLSAADLETLRQLAKGNPMGKRAGHRHDDHPNLTEAAAHVLRHVDWLGQAAYFDALHRLRWNCEIPIELDDTTHEARLEELAALDILAESIERLRSAFEQHNNPTSPEPK